MSTSCNESLQTDIMSTDLKKDIAHFHLPGLFEFFDFYKVFLPVFYDNRNYFHDWADIASIYGAPSDCIWGGGRIEEGHDSAEEILDFLHQYGISARLTFSNSLLRKEHLSDSKCNRLCALFEKKNDVANGVIVHSELLLSYLQERYPRLYFTSSTTKVLTDFEQFRDELKRDDFRYAVPDFRLNKQFDNLETLTAGEREKVEFLCNECCYIGCRDRRACYEDVSRKILGESGADHVCAAPGGKEGYLFSKAKENPAFIGAEDIVNTYMPRGFSNFKIEGRSLGSAVVFECLLYYLAKPEYQLQVREKVYLDSMLDLF